jgi:hypothetical protein
VVLLRLRFLSRWRLLFLSDQASENEAQRDGEAARAGNGHKISSSLYSYMAKRRREELRPAFKCARNHWIRGFPVQIQVSISPVEPSFECLHNSGLQRAGGARHGMRYEHGTRCGGELDVGTAGRHSENDEQGAGSLPPWARKGRTAWATGVSAQARNRK